jgi:hypothetical protein
MPETAKHPCESCSMPIESGRYCEYCVTGTGELQTFGERFERMVGWQLRQKPGLSRAEAERRHAPLHVQNAGVERSPAGLGGPARGVEVRPEAVRAPRLGLAARGVPLAQVPSDTASGHGPT